MLHDREFRQLYAELVDCALSGRITCGALTNCQLALIPKPGGGARPIGMGTILRRVAGKLAARAAGAELRKITEPADQYGLSESGTVRLYHAVRTAADEGKLVVSLDVRNAFNTLSRDVIMRTVNEVPTAAQAFCAVLYGQPTTFVAPDFSLAGRSAASAGADEPTLLEALEGVGDVPHWRFATETGVIQGCPMAPLLFAATMARIVGEVQAGLLERGVRVMAFHDYVYLVSDSASALGDAFVSVRDALSAVGMTLAPLKCQTLLPSVDVAGRGSGGAGGTCGAHAEAEMHGRPHSGP
jgi:hypothetical protein